MISVVIPALNEEARITECLNALRAQTRQADEIIVVDGGSSDATVALARNFQAQVLHNPRRHAAAARNIGINAAKGDIIAFTDADCIPAENWVEQIEAAFTDPLLEGLGGKVIAAPPENAEEAFWSKLALEVLMTFGDEAYTVQAQTINDAFITANAAYRASLLHKLDGFDEWFANNAEDVDLTWRALQTGAVLRYIPAVQVAAHGVTTVKGIRKKSFRNGVSSSKLQKRYSGFFNCDPRIYSLLGKKFVAMLHREPQADWMVMELVWHLLGKYYGSLKVGVINV